jgi:hypothetical protein
MTWMVPRVTASLKQAQTPKSMRSLNGEYLSARSQCTDRLLILLERNLEAA